MKPPHFDRLNGQAAKKRIDKKYGKQMHIYDFAILHGPQLLRVWGKWKNGEVRLVR